MWNRIVFLGVVPLFVISTAVLTLCQIWQVPSLWHLFFAVLANVVWFGLVFRPRYNQAMRQRREKSLQDWKAGQQEWLDGH